MSNLIVIGYDDLFKAEETRLKLVKMQRDYLIDLEDAVVAVKDKDGKVKLNQAYPLTQMGAVGGGFWGALVGMLFLIPCWAPPSEPEPGPFPAPCPMSVSTTNS
jgi:uncharacterized membrane protein